jgi:hypothetical protein
VGSAGRPRAAIASAVIAVAVVAIAVVLAPTPAPTPPVLVGALYGVGLNVDTLANAQVGGTGGSTSFRFRASTSSALRSIRIYMIGLRHPGYSGGTGGRIQISVQPDGDGSPSGDTLASTTIAPSDDAGLVVSFPSPASLTAGQLYHIVFRNVDAAPTVNFVSVDSLYVYGSTLTPRQPMYSDTDWAQLVNYNDGRGWQISPRFTPILNLTYANGEVAGVGYMEVWVYDYQVISGTKTVRETFTVSGASRQVSSVAVRLRRTSGSSPLTLRLETSSGALVAQTSVPATSIAASAPGGDNGGAVWAVGTFPKVTLTAGQGYNLVLSTASNTEYTVFVIRKGPTYGYSPRTYFNDGYAQYNTDSGWSGFKGDTQGDLQFYLK